VFDEKDSDKSAIRLLIDFQKALQATKPIDPGEGAFDLPPLATVAFLRSLFAWQFCRVPLAVASIRSQRHDPAAAQRLP
jgi:hypothetical protein